LLVVVVGLWSLWLFWCAPSACVRLAVLCWVFKRAFIASLVFIPLAIVVPMAVAVVLVIIAYGSAAGILVHSKVPSARLPLTQIPF
jgi:hypothetical protein